MTNKIGRAEKQYASGRLHVALTERFNRPEEALVRAEIAKEFGSDKLVADAEKAIAAIAKKYHVLTGNRLVVQRTARWNDEGCGKIGERVKAVMAKKQATYDAAVKLYRDYEEKIMFLDTPSELGVLLSEFRVALDKIKA